MDKLVEMWKKLSGDDCRQTNVQETKRVEKERENEMNQDRKKKKYRERWMH